MTRGNRAVEIRSCVSEYLEWEFLIVNLFWITVWNNIRFSVISSLATCKIHQLQTRRSKIQEWLIHFAGTLKLSFMTIISKLNDCGVEICKTVHAKHLLIIFLITYMIGSCVKFVFTQREYMMLPTFNIYRRVYWVFGQIIDWKRL